MKNITLGLIVAVGLTMTADARSLINLDALQRDGYGVVSISRPRVNEMIVRAAINNRPLDLILDTGFQGPGKGVLLNQSLARAMNEQTTPVQGPGRTWTGAQLKIEQTLGNSVQMGNVRITDVPLYFSNLGLYRIANMRSASGVISVGFLRATSAIIDIQNRRLYLRPPGLGRRAMIGQALKETGMAEVPLTGNGGHFFVDVDVNGLIGKMVVDSGATFTMLEKGFAEQAKISHDRQLRMVDAAGKMRQTNAGTIYSFRIGGVPVYAPNLTFGSATFGRENVVGIIGMDVLGQNWGIIDCGEQKLYLSHVR